LVALIIIFRHLEDNLDDWLTEELDNYLDDDYLVFDCPGIHDLFSASIVIYLCFSSESLMFEVFGGYCDYEVVIILL